MSRENVEVVRLAFGAANARDTGTIDSLYRPEAVMDFSDSPFADFANPVVCHGMDEIKTAFQDFYMAFENVESEVKDLIDAGEQVISVFTYRGKGRASGIDTEWRDMAGVWAFRDGKITRVTWLRDRAAALEAVGLSE